MCDSKNEQLAPCNLHTGQLKMSCYICCMKNYHKKTTDLSNTCVTNVVVSAKTESLENVRISAFCPNCGDPKSGGCSC